MKRSGLLLVLGSILVLGAVQGRAQTPSHASTGPDVLCLVYQRPGLGDQIDITYSHIVPQAQAHRDVGALAKAAGWTIANGQMSNGVPPVQNKIGAMTSVTFDVPQAIRNETHTLPVEAFVTAFKSYKTLGLIFIVDSSFQFQGWRQYADNNVRITLDQHGSAYTYRVTLLNSQFDRLNLPSAGQTADTALAARHKGRSSPLALIPGIVGAAALVGVLVYVLTYRLTPAPKKILHAEDETPQEKETLFGPRG